MLVARGEDLARPRRSSAALEEKVLVGLPMKMSERARRSMSIKGACRKEVGGEEELVEEEEEEEEEGEII